MSLVYAGSFPLEVACSASFSAVVSASAALNAALAPLQLQITAALGLQVGITLSPPEIAANIELCVSLIADLTLALSLALPSLDFQLSACISLIAELGPIVLALQAALALVTSLSANLETGGILAYSYSGTGAAFGPALSSALASGLIDGTPAAGQCAGVILAATASATWAGLSSFFSGGISTAPGLSLTGSLTLGELCVSLSAAIDAAILSLTLQLGSYKGQLSAALSAQARLLLTPPSIAGNVTLVADLKASLTAYLTVGGFILPSVAIEASANILVQLGKTVASLTAQVSALASLTATFATSGILAYTYSGPVNGLGPAVAAAIGSGWPDSTTNTAPANALVLLATAPAAQAGLDVFFGGLTA